MTDVLFEYFALGDTTSVDISLNLDIGRCMTDSISRLLLEKGYSSISSFPPTVGSRTAKSLHKYDVWHMEDSIHNIIRTSDGRDTLYTKALPLYIPPGSQIDSSPPYTLDGFIHRVANQVKSDSNYSEDNADLEDGNLLVFICVYSRDRPNPSFPKPYKKWFIWDVFNTDIIFAALAVYVIEIESGRLLYSNTPEPFLMKPSKENFLDRIHELVEDFPSLKSF